MDQNKVIVLTGIQAVDMSITHTMSNSRVSQNDASKPAVTAERQEARERRTTLTTLTGSLSVAV